MKVVYKGVEIEGGSTSEILKMIKALKKLRSYNDKKLPLEEKKFHRSKIEWLEEEIEFIITNLDKNYKFFRDDFINDRHTKAGVVAMYFAIKMKDNKRLSPLVKSVMQKHNLI